MIGSPHRQHHAGQMSGVRQQKSAAIVGAERAKPFVGMLSPWMGQVLAPGKTDEVNDL
jgi:hypothetical protein